MGASSGRTKTIITFLKNSQMKKKIFKYPLEIIDQQVISMPIGSEILTVQTQMGRPCLWALVDPNAQTENRHIEMFGTGNPIDSNCSVPRRYISTFQIKNGELVFHVFETSEF